MEFSFIRWPTQHYLNSNKEAGHIVSKFACIICESPSEQNKCLHFSVNSCWFVFFFSAMELLAEARKYESYFCGSSQEGERKL